METKMHWLVAVSVLFSCGETRTVDKGGFDMSPPDLGSDTAGRIDVTDAGSTDAETAAETDANRRDTRSDGGVDLQQSDASIPSPSGCDVEPYRRDLALPHSRLMVASDDVMWIWGRDHYLDVIDATTSLFVSVTDSEIIRPRFFPLEPIDGLQRYVTQGGAVHAQREGRLYFSTDRYLTESVSVLAVVDDAFFAVTPDSELYRCEVEVACEVCSLDDQCQFLSRLPESEAQYVSETFVRDGDVFWAGTDSIWATNLETGMSTAVATNVSPRMITVNSSGALAWVNETGQLRVRYPDGTSQLVANELPTPRFSGLLGNAYLDAHLDVVALGSEYLFWSDGVETWAFDLAERIVSPVAALADSEIVQLKVSRCAYFLLTSETVERIPR